LLVARTGLHLDLGLMRRRRTTTLAVSGAGLIIPLTLGIGAGLVLPATLRPSTADPTLFAIFLGVALSMSAIPVIAKTLIDMNLFHRNIGQLILASSTVDDAFGWLMLAVVSAMVVTGATAAGITVAVASLLGVIVFAYVIGRPLVRVIMRAAHRSTERSVPISVAVILVLLSAAGTHALGLEPVFGAFLCGILIGTCPAREPDWAAPLVTTVLSVLAPVYFATAGLRIDLSALLRPEVAVAAVVIVGLAIVGKFAGAFTGGLFSGLTRWESVALGAGMNARGVIEVIIAMVGLRIGLLNTAMYTVIVLVAVVTSVMAPPVLRFAMRRVEQTADERLRADEQASLRSRSDAPLPAGVPSGQP
jgi:Kef-type K+ transport system membrane component KefB